MFHWLTHILGLDNLSGRWYGWWSGFGSDISEFAIIGALWHTFNCHDPGCPRLGRHVTMEGGVHVRRCARHHRAAVQ